MTELALVPSGEIPADAPSYGELSERLQAAEELNLGQEATIKSQAAMIGRLKRKVEASDPEAHPQHAEMTKLIDRWKEGTGHKNAKHSKDRYDVIRARLKDGYSIEHLELAIDGISACPYVVNSNRVPEGKPSQRHDSLSIALKGGENLERFAVIGAIARRQS